MARLQTSPAQLTLPSLGLESSHATAAPSYPDEVRRDDVLPVQGGFRLGLMSNPLGSDSDLGRITLARNTGREWEGEATTGCRSAGQDVARVSCVRQTTGSHG